MGELEPRKLRGMKGVNMDFAEKFPGGVWPVMLTPYTEKGALDEDALAALTEWYVGSGVKGLFAACQSGGFGGSLDREFLQASGQTESGYKL